MESISEDISGLRDFIIQYPWVLLIPVFFIFVRFLIYMRRRRIRKFMMRRADETLKLLRNMDFKKDGARMFGLMRAMSPFAFEEMILTALSDRGFKIKRNGWYMGDGGLDGQFWIGKTRVLIQAKRYKNHIERLHVEDFCKLCKRYKAKGIFVHTGRTGKASRAHANDDENIEIISGQALLNLFAGRRFVLFEKEYFN